MDPSLPAMVLSNVKSLQLNTLMAVSKTSPSYFKEFPMSCCTSTIVIRYSLEALMLFRAWLIQVKIFLREKKAVVSCYLFLRTLIPAKSPAKAPHAWLTRLEKWRNVLLQLLVSNSKASVV